MALNAAMQGRSTEGVNLPPVPEDSFEKVALPVAKKKNLGVLAMKAIEVACPSRGSRTSGRLPDRAEETSEPRQIGSSHE